MGFLPSTLIDPDPDPERHYHLNHLDTSNGPRQTLKGENRNDSFWAKMIQSNRKRQSPNFCTSYKCHLVFYLSYIKLLVSSGILFRIIYVT